MTAVSSGGRFRGRGGGVEDGREQADLGVSGDTMNGWHQYRVRRLTHRVASRCGPRSTGSTRPIPSPASRCSTSSPTRSRSSTAGPATDPGTRPATGAAGTFRGTGAVGRRHARSTPRSRHRPADAARRRRGPGHRPGRRRRGRARRSGLTDVQRVLIEALFPAMTGHAGRRRRLRADDRRASSRTALARPRPAVPDARRADHAAVRARAAAAAADGRRPRSPSSRASSTSTRR